jgi:hypothetical protein
MYESTSSATRCFSLRSSLAFKLALTFTLLLTAVSVVDGQVTSVAVFLVDRPGGGRRLILAPRRNRIGGPSWQES